MEARYRSTLWACCFANFFQAVGSCFAILYVPLRGLYGLSFTDFGILVSLNFITQVASDVLFSKPVEKYGFRPFAVAAPLVSAAGLGLFAAAPILFPQRPFAGFCAGMFLFAAAGGLQELLLSPILDALPIPEERKARSMSMLHSFFAWGQIFVVLATTGLLAVWGAARWQWIVLLWAAPPVAGAALFCRVPLARKNGGAPAAAGAGPQRRVLRAAGGHRAGRRGRGDHGPVGVGLFGKGPAAAEAGGRRVGRVLFLADACAGAQRLCGAGRARAAAPAAHRRQRRGRRAVRGLRACTKPSAGGAGLRAYGPLRQPAVAGRDHSCVPAHPLRGGGHVRAAFRGRRCGRVPGGVLRGPRGGLGAGVRHGVCGGRGGIWGAARGPAAGGGVPAAVLRRAHGAALHRSAGRLTRRERTAAQAIEESCFSNRNRRLQTGRKTAK